MPSGANLGAGYVQPADPNLYLDAEDTGRTVGGWPVVLQRVKDDATGAALALLLTELQGKLEPADLAAVASAAKQDAAKAVLDAILAAVDGLEVNTGGLANQTTLAAVLAELGQKVEPGDLAALATTAKQDAAKARLDLLASEAKLEAVRALLAGTLMVETELSAAGALATEAKLEAVRALLAGTLAVSGPLTDTQLRALAVAVSGTVALDAGTLAALETITVANPTANPETGLAKDATFTARTPPLVGTWDYHAGISGTAVIPAGERVIGIAAHATGGGASLAINGGGSVPIPANSGLAIAPIGNLVAPTVVFTATDSWFLEVLR